MGQGADRGRFILTDDADGVDVIVHWPSSLFSSTEDEGQRVPPQPDDGTLGLSLCSTDSLDGPRIFPSPLSPFISQPPGMSDPRSFPALNVAPSPFLLFPGRRPILIPANSEVQRAPHIQSVGVAIRDT